MKTYKDWKGYRFSPSQKTREIAVGVRRTLVSALLAKTPGARRESDTLAIIIPGKYGLAVKAKTFRALLKSIDGLVEIRMNDKKIEIYHSYSESQKRFTGKATLIPYFQNNSQIVGKVQL
jgi:hypothetical protein